jgi:hypothetical protein
MSAITHARRNTPTARAVATAVITGLSKHPDDDQRVVYMMAVRNALGAALRKELETMSDVIRNFLNAAERRTYDKVKAETKAEAVLKILAKRGLPLAPLQRRQIEGCTDLETLDRWFDQALTAASVDELFGKAKRNGHRAPRRNGTRTARRA